MTVLDIIMSQGWLQKFNRTTMHLRAVASIPIPNGRSLHPVKNRGGPGKIGEFCLALFFTGQTTH